ncbi:hypothetical protein FF38_07129 [Lucilia cuprina]|uniref:Uncharacterized protein n=1 Tax=Lucilia cuprina TaxID=7375 RepID=A0A0L0C9I6_LUCCU|nr:hypothetical protein FF38_07129 [Lucilia cuprina]
MEFTIENPRSAQSRSEAKYQSLSRWLLLRLKTSSPFSNMMMANVPVVRLSRTTWHTSLKPSIVSFSVEQEGEWETIWEMAPSLLRQSTIAFNIDKLKRGWSKSPRPHPVYQKVLARSLLLWSVIALNIEFLTISLKDLLMTLAIWSLLPLPENHGTNTASSAPPVVRTPQQGVAIDLAGSPETLKPQTECEGYYLGVFLHFWPAAKNKTLLFHWEHIDQQAAQLPQSRGLQTVINVDRTISETEEDFYKAFLIDRPTWNVDVCQAASWGKVSAAQ